MFQIHIKISQSKCWQTSGNQRSLVHRSIQSASTRERVSDTTNCYTAHRRIFNLAANYERQNQLSQFLLASGYSLCAWHMWTCPYVVLFINPSLKIVRFTSSKDENISQQPLQCPSTVLTLKGWRSRSRMQKSKKMKSFFCHNSVANSAVYFN